MKRPRAFPVGRCAPGGSCPKGIALAVTFGIATASIAAGAAGCAGTPSRPTLPPPDYEDPAAPVVDGGPG